MMLQLFKEEEKFIPLQMNLNEAIENAHLRLTCALDKGNILNLSSFENEKSPTGFTQWFNDIVNGEWLNNLLHSCHQCQEIIGHHPSQIQIISHIHTLNQTFPWSAKDWELMLQIFSLSQHKEWNFKKPFISFEYNGSRLSLMHYSLTNTKSSKFFLRNHSEELFPFENQEIEDFIKKSVDQGDNMIISGSTGSGKTSFLSSLLGLIPVNEHPILIEDTPEILMNHPNLTRLVSDESETQKITDLIKYALRMSPSRFVIGEIRSKEITGLIQAMNTGHKGVYSTVHASSGFDTIHRLAQLFCLYGENNTIKYEHVLQALTRNVQVVVFLEKRKVKEIIRILGIENDSPLYEKIY